MTDFQPGDLVEVISEPMCHVESGEKVPFVEGWGGEVPFGQFTVSSAADDDGDVWLWTGDLSAPVSPDCLALVFTLSERLAGLTPEDVLRNALLSNDWRVRRWARELLA